MNFFKRDRTFKEPIGKLTTFFMAAFHVGAIVALFMFTWKAFFVALLLWWVAGSLGIGMAYHRLLTHRGFKTYKWMEYFRPSALHWRWKAARFSGWQRTASITRTLTWKAIRTLLATAASGHIWAGS